MRKRTNLCYLADLWRETWSGTFTFLREHIIPEIVFVVITFMVTATYKYYSGGDAMSAVSDSLVISAVAALIVFICILIVNYGNADFNLWRADGKELDIKDAEIDLLNKRIHDLKKIKPDMTIADAFDYVISNANLIEKYPQTNPYYLSSIAATVIKDELSLDKLYLWGRKADQSFGQDSDISAYALERIEVDNWNEFSFTFYWEDYDEEIALYGEVKVTRLVQATYAQNRYFDLQFCSAQLMSIWPEDLT
jgi:hypothetical protein